MAVPAQELRLGPLRQHQLQDAGKPAAELVQDQPQELRPAGGPQKTGWWRHQAGAEQQQPALQCLLLAERHLAWHSASLPLLLVLTLWQALLSKLAQPLPRPVTQAGPDQIAAHSTVGGTTPAHHACQHSSMLISKRLHTPSMHSVVLPARLCAGQAPACPRTTFPALLEQLQGCQSQHLAPNTRLGHTGWKSRTSSLVPGKTRMWSSLRHLASLSKGMGPNPKPLIQVAMVSLAAGRHRPPQPICGHAPVSRSAAGACCPMCCQRMVRIQLTSCARDRTGTTCRRAPGSCRS